jgi:serine/threonine protein kinase/dipeptidyl aminopeptidase/acylaminoacyl peptidase
LSKGALESGDRLGPYRIIGLLGRGGMGEVYRAHDARLGRDVAVKIMRGSSADPEQVARFSREARAAGSLNHPNIVAVFDVGSEGGVPYVVTELLEGETLRARMNRGLLPYRKAIDFGIQIAQALDAAHGKGIWHRDVKPANVFITTDGRVKLLDFGIAKLSEQIQMQSQRAHAEDLTTEDSRTGEIHGTPGYMSPEQVLGHAVDHRADIFAFGTVLYEMLTGARAFQRASASETMNAVLQADPVDPVAINAGLPPVAAAVVRRCLDKNKEERFQSARDLAFDLQQLRDSTGRVTPLEEGTSRPRPFNWRRALVAAVILLGAALTIALWRLSWATPSPSFEPLTFRRGRIGGARFAAGGVAVVYSEASQGHALEISRLDFADSPSSRSLNYEPGTDVLAARAGELALLLEPRFVQGERFVGNLAVAPFGGAPRQIGKNIEYADWSRSGELAWVKSTGAVGGESQIEYPPGQVLYKSGNILSFLRVSPDGQRVAFLEDKGDRRGPSGFVSVVDRSGKVTPLTGDWESVRGLAWSPTGREIWFTAGKARENRALRAVTLGRKERVVYQAPGMLTLWDIAADGGVLLTRDEERRAVVALPPGETLERDLSWFDLSGVAAISNDGRWLLCGDRFGVYLRGTDGSPPGHVLSNAWADDLAPDAKTVLATMDAGRKLVFVPGGSGAPQLLPPHGIIQYSGAWWFPNADGRRVLFTGKKDGERLRSYVQDVGGGPPTAVTPEGQWAVAISPNGQWLAGTSTAQGTPLWSVTGEQKIVPGSKEGERPVAWSADGKSLWLFRRGEVPAEIYTLEIATGRHDLKQKLTPPDAAGVYSIIEFQITPSGRAYAYSYTRLLSQLYLARGLK